MADKYIKRQNVETAQYDACRECREACEEFDGFYSDCNQCLLHSVIEKVKEIPAADVQPVRHGRWVKTADFSDEPIDWVVCDRCKAKIPDFDYSYCPMCGAIMDGEA